jgi:Animal haem peroxidase
MTAEALEKLAQSMRQSQPAEDRPGYAPSAAAVTYFGQFVDHDLTMDTTPLREAESSEPIYTTNYRTPWLDLDHVYGDGPCSSRHHHLYESDEASFCVARAPDGGEPFDVPFTHDGCVALADERNGENIILRQIHAMFLKLHNVAVRNLPKTLSPRERFDRARDRVRWQYQWLVREWYLLEVCHQEVWEAVFEDGERRIDWSQDGFAIPVEFSAAVMRFGHSMVRASYQMRNGGEDLPLARLFGMRNNRALNRALKIDWEFFTGLQPGSRPTANANAIDTTIAEPLFELPDEHINLYVRTPVPHPPPALALRTLKRGASIRLPTGQQVRDALGEGPIPEAGIDPWPSLRSVGLDQHTPLWYYILLEAELSPGLADGAQMKRKNGGFGSTLGKLGSRLAAEVIYASLQDDPSSFVRRGLSLPLEPWPMPDGTPIEVKTLADVAKVAGV